MSNSFEQNLGQENSSAENMEGRVLKLEQLAEEFGFTETTEMRELKTEIYELPSEQYDEWLQRAEDEVQKSSDYDKAKLGLMLSQAGIYSKFASSEDFSEAIDDARMYAQQMGYAEVANMLKDL